MVSTVLLMYLLSKVVPRELTNRPVMGESCSQPRERLRDQNFDVVQHTAEHCQIKQLPFHADCIPSHLQQD